MNAHGTWVGRQGGFAPQSTAPRPIRSARGPSPAPRAYGAPTPSSGLAARRVPRAPSRATRPAFESTGHSKARGPQDCLGPQTPGNGGPGRRPSPAGAGRGAQGRAQAGAAPGGLERGGPGAAHRRRLRRVPAAAALHDRAVLQLRRHAAGVHAVSSRRSAFAGHRPGPSTAACRHLPATNARGLDTTFAARPCP